MPDERLHSIGVRQGFNGELETYDIEAERAAAMTFRILNNPGTMASLDMLGEQIHLLDPAVPSTGVIQDAYQALLLTFGLGGK